MKKKLIEVAIPLEAINKASAREKSIRHGHPSTLHLWWARRPLAAARAVIFAQMVDDPSGHPELFPTAEDQEKERQRLFRLIEELVKWENTTNEELFKQAHEEMLKSWRMTCAENKNHPRAAELFNPDKLPAFHDPFAGGGSLPLEAQRLGLESYASDLNPVAVLINKAMIEIPPKFAGKPPVNPKTRANKDLFARQWKGAQGLAEDVRYYGEWMRNEAEKRIGHLYPKVEITEEMAKERPDLKPLVGQKLTVIAWLWARTVKSPNPAFATIDVPLISTFMLSTKEDKEAYIEPVVEKESYRFLVRMGKPKNEEDAKNGTKLARGANFRCIMSKDPIAGEHIKAEGKAGRMGARLMAIAAEGERSRIYLSPSIILEEIAQKAEPCWSPEVEISPDRRSMFTPLYGLTHFNHLFTPRQLVALTTFSDLIQEVREKINQDALNAGLSEDNIGLELKGIGASSYADSCAIYLSCGISRSADFWSNLCIWANQPKNELVTHLFGRQAIPMVWDYAEANPFSDSGGNFEKNISYVAKGVDFLTGVSRGYVEQVDASTNNISYGKIISTDPPYYDNIGYADLSDYFYIWLRRSLKPFFPQLFATVAVPKTEELVAAPYRHGGKDKAEQFFLEGMTKAMHQLATQCHPEFPVSIYYAFKQSESEDDGGTASTGWETFLAAVIKAGFSIDGTWPIRTERQGRMSGNDTNALASSIVLVCRQRLVTATTATRREFVNALKTELPTAVAHLQKGNIAPVDLAQSAIGPGMAIYTRYEKVIDAEGNPLTVRDALTLINQILDEVLAEQEGDFDSDSRWALSWFEQFGFTEGEYGIAETLSKAKNTSVSGLVEACILTSKSGKVRLLKPEELPKDWNPETDSRLTVWEMVHHLIRVLSSSGESGASELVKKLGAKADVARELAYRLYNICERKKRAAEALAYNGLVQSWNEIIRLSQDTSTKFEQVFSEVLEAPKGKAKKGKTKSNQTSLLD
jgi:putative DNA methylase